MKNTIVKTIITLAVAASGLVACGGDSENQGKWDQFTDTQKREMCIVYSMFNRNDGAFIEYLVEEGDMPEDKVTRLTSVLNEFCW